MSVLDENSKFTVVYFIYRLLIGQKKISARGKTLSENKCIWCRHLTKIRPIPNSGHKFEPMSVNFRLKMNMVLILSFHSRTTDPLMSGVNLYCTFCLYEKKLRVRNGLDSQPAGSNSNAEEELCFHFPETKTF
jgi:hypothetical protein